MEQKRPSPREQEEHSYSPEPNNDGFEPDNIQEEGEGDNQPLLFVDVNLGVGKQERIVVCDGDRADELAERFANMHSKAFCGVLSDFNRFG